MGLGGKGERATRSCGGGARLCAVAPPTHPFSSATLRVTELMTPTATVIFMSRTAKRPSGG